MIDRHVDRAHQVCNTVAVGLDGDRVLGFAEAVARLPDLTPWIRPFSNTIWTKERGKADEQEPAHGGADQCCTEADFQIANTASCTQGPQTSRRVSEPAAASSSNHQRASRSQMYSP